MTIRNTGSGGGWPRITGSDVDDFKLASGGSWDLPGTLQPGEICTMRVAFSPVAARNHSARREVPEETGSGATTRSVALTGMARPVPRVPVVPAPPAAPATPAVVPAAAPVAAPSTGVLDQTAQSSRATIGRLTIPATVSRARVRAQGVRLVLRIRGEANGVRVRIYRSHDNKRGARVAQRYRSPTAKAAAQH